MIDVDFREIENQSIAYNTLKQRHIKELLYGGAKGGGKSVFGCYWSYDMAYKIAEKYFPEKPEHPVPVGFMGRKIGRDFKDTTLNTWKRFIPAENYVIKGKPAEIIIWDRVKILTGGLDRSEEIQKFNSAELAFFFIDQAEETLIDDISALRASLRLTLNGEELDYKGLFTANPRQCWLKDEFILNPAPFRKFVKALPGDNPLLPSTYIDILKDAFKHRPELLRAYLYGDWSAIEGAEQVIKNEWIEEMKLRTCYAPRVKRYLVCDTARFGDDECVMYLMENCEILGKKILGRTSAPDIVNRLVALSHQVTEHYGMKNKCQIVIEVVGADMGGAVSDYLTKAGMDVVEFHPGNKSEIKNPQGKPVYHNLRAEAWSKAAKIMSSGVLDEETNTVVECKNMYQTLQTQLCEPNYKFAETGGRILIEEKSKIKERMNRSPDHADAYVIALWAWDMIDYADDDDDEIGYRDKKKRERRRSPMRM